MPLGQFEQNNGELVENKRKVVGELKDPGTELNKVDPSRLKSPIEQAFGSKSRSTAATTTAGSSTPRPSDYPRGAGRSQPAFDSNPVFLF